MSIEWCCLRRDYEAKKTLIKGVQVFDQHPLKTTDVTLINSKGSNGNILNARKTATLLVEPLGLGLDGFDPLSQFARHVEIDPLSEMIAENVNVTKERKQNEMDVLESSNMPIWATQRINILNKFTTSEKLSITTSFLSGGEMMKSKTTVTNKVKYRLEQLDDFEAGSVRQMMDLTQQEYILNIEQLNQELVQSWNGNQRVKALKIAIQCSKMLSDTSVMQFYPSQFVLITDTLDIFGKLVYERLKIKADYSDFGKNTFVSLPENFTPEMVPDSAKETCQNWFYKIASIRELLPRIYVEIAILKCYNFLTQSDFNLVLLRLVRMIRGIGNPLVASYARCYLVRVGMIVSKDNEYMKENLQDFLMIYYTIFNGSIRSEINRQRITMASYLSLYRPALNWLLQCLVHQSSDSYSQELLKMCKTKKNNGPLLFSILSSFKSDFIANHAVEISNIISNSNTEGITKGELFRTLGASLCHSPPPPDQMVALFKGAFTTINTFTNIGEYIDCIEMWAQLTAEHFSLNEVNNLLSEIRLRMNQNKSYENYYAQLQSIIDKFVRYNQDFEGLLTLDNFLPLLDLFQKDSVRFDVCKLIMSTYKNNYCKKTADPVVTNTLMYLCKVINDNVNAMTVEDERRQIGVLISNFIKNVDLGTDFEKQLSFYVEARAAFPNLDAVLTTLVHCVNNLAIKTRRAVNGTHSKKTAAFVKGCVAYCFITIPSIVAITTKMNLYLLSGQVALLNTCLGQADACFESALNLVAELPQTMEIEGKLKSTEEYLVSYLCNVLSTIIIVPDSPEQGLLYLVRLLLDVLKKYPFDIHSTGPAIIYLHTLDILYVESSEVFPYHVPNVVSNDELYGSDPKFLTEVNSMCSETVNNILEELKVLGDLNQLRVQATLALELLIRIVRYSDLNDTVLPLALNLWSLAVKYDSNINPKTPVKILKIVEQYKLHSKHREYSSRVDELILRMKNKL